jgi:hypothetical protein
MVKTLNRIVMVALLLVATIMGQSLEERLQQLAAKNAKNYVNPLVTAFGTAMNSGWYHTAQPHKLLGFDLGVKVMAVSFPKDQKSFVFDLSSLGTIEETISIGGNSYTLSFEPNDIYPETEVPTFFGDDEEGRVLADNIGIKSSIETQLLNQGVSQQIIDQSQIQDQINTVAESIPDIVTPPGTNLPAWPMVVPQVALGLSVPTLPIKAEVVARYFPEVEVSEDIGKFKFMGLGGKLALDPFVPAPMFGIKVSVGAFFQKMEVGKIFESNHSLYSLMVSRDFSLMVAGVGIYGGIGKENSDVKINYTYNNANNPNDPLNGTKVKFDLEGENSFRTTIGARIRLAVINIHADYSMGADNVITAGVGLTLR